jgi:sugar lactone lactonase YvrE
MTARIPTFLLPSLFRHAILSACLSVVVLAQSTTPPPVYHWTTLAGRASPGQDDGVAALARFNSPHGLATDQSGNLYIADTDNHTVRKITPTGTVSTYAGSPGQAGRTDGTVITARFNGPQGVAVDSSGNVFVADTGNNLIRIITPAGGVSTIAGQPGIKGSLDGPVATATINGPAQLAVAASGIVYFADNGIRRISDGKVATIFTQGQIPGDDGQVYTVTPGTSVAIDSSGQLYFSAYASPLPAPWSAGTGLCLVKMDTTGGLSFTVGPSMWADPGYVGRSIGPLTVDHAGGIYFFAAVDVYFGTLYPSYSVGPAGISGGSGSVVSSAGWPDQPLGLAKDFAGSTYYTRSSDNVIFKNGNIFAGTAWSNIGVDGLGAAARFAGLSNLAVDPAGNIWGADQIQVHFYDNHGGFGTELRKSTPNGTVSTSALIYPNLVTSTYGQDVTTDSFGNVYFATFPAGYGYEIEISKIASDGSTTTLPPIDTPYPYNPYNARLAANPAGTLITAGGDNLVRILTSSGWSVLAGNIAGNAIVDGTGSTAQFGQIGTVTADQQGNFYVLDAKTGPNETGGECFIRRITTAGAVTTVSRNLVIATGLTGIYAELSPHGLAVDSHGSFFVLYPDSTVRQVAPTGDPVVIGGLSWVPGSMDGNGSQALFAEPWSITVDLQDNLYLSDSAGTTIRKGQYLGLGPAIISQPQSMSASAGSSALFSVIASGTPGPTYQWYFGGAALVGATGTNLSLTNIRSTDAGDYTVVVTNALGSVTSGKATLTVSAAPTPTPTSTPASTGSGGGGAGNAWFLLALLALMAGRGFGPRGRR